MHNLSIGPTPVAPFAKQAFQIDIHHKSEQFKKFYIEFQIKLKLFFETKNHVYSLAGTGTAAMEFAARRVKKVNKKSLVINAGFFGNLWGKVLSNIGCEFDNFLVNPQQGFDFIGLKKLILENDYNAVFIQGCETSNGYLNPIYEIGELIKNNSNSLYVVDACSYIESNGLATDNNFVDVMLTSSHKLLMCPVGASFICFSPQSLQRTDSENSLYFSTGDEVQLNNNGLTRWTPPVQILYAVNAVLDKFQNGNIGKYQLRMQQLNNLIPKMLNQFQYTLFPYSSSNTLTVLKVPPLLDAMQVCLSLNEKYNVFILPGLGENEKKLIRIGHMGYITNESIYKAILSLSDIAGNNSDFSKNLKSSMSGIIDISDIFKTEFKM